MRNPARSFALAAILAAGGLQAVPAQAVPNKIPSPANSTRPTVIRVVGRGADGPDASGTFTIVLRDLANNPLADDRVVIDFSQCPDVRLATEAAPGQYVDCASRTVAGFSDMNGAVTFTIVGAGTNLGAAAGAALNCAAVSAEGVMLSHPTVCIYDQDGAVRMPGMGATDLFSFVRDLGSGMFFGRSDFDGSGALDVRDLSKFLVVMGTGQSSLGSASGYCP